MKINTIVFDQPPGTKASNAPRGGDGDFQIAYAHILDDSSAPLARDVATAQPSRGQDSSPHRDDAAHTVRVGETLYGIVRARLATMGVQANAKASMLGVKQLAQANSIHNPDRIYVGQKLDLSALDSSFGHQVAPQTSNIDRPATAASGINQPQQWHWKEPEPESGAQITAEVAALPPTIDTLPLAIDTLPPTIPRNEIAAPVDAGTRTPLAMRQVALYEQNGSIAPAKPAEVALALPDIVYKGVIGKVLDAMPLEPSTRTALQQTNALVISTVAARALGALTGFGAPLLTVAGLIWGVFSARQINAAATGAPNPAGDSRPTSDAIQMAQNRPSEARN